MSPGISVGIGDSVGATDDEGDGVGVGICVSVGDGDGDGDSDGVGDRDGDGVFVGIGVGVRTFVVEEGILGVVVRVGDIVGDTVGAMEATKD